METLNNVASAASRAVFGSGSDNKEPVSGEQGDVSKGEPYDAGNMDETEQKKLEGDQPATDEVKNDVEESGKTGAGDQEEVIKQPDGPGPKPLAEIAREHGGDAGIQEGASKDADNKDGEAVEGAVAGEDGKEQGTGEQYVKTSGLAADGGDFDATKPGAGREADRLMEQKGMHVNEDAKKKKDEVPSTTPAKDATAKKDKPSLGDRIKAKFRKH